MESAEIVSWYKYSAQFAFSQERRDERHPKISGVFPVDCESILMWWRDSI